LKHGHLPEETAVQEVIASSEKKHIFTHPRILRKRGQLTGSDLFETQRRAVPEIVKKFIIPEVNKLSYVPLATRKVTFVKNNNVLGGAFRPATLNLKPE
jgi:hypothetical protein